MDKLISFLAAMFFAVTLAPGAYATAPQPDELVISIDGLDLSLPQDRTELAPRIERAVQSYCESRPRNQLNPYPGDLMPPPSAKVFAPGLVSTDQFEGLPAYSPDMAELYFIRQGRSGPSSYHVLRKSDDGWSIDIVETTDKGGTLSISPDASTMFLGNELRVRDGTKWSALRSLGGVFDNYDIMRLTVSQNGTVVFDERDEGGKIRYIRANDDPNAEPIVFGPEINRGTFVAHPFIATDGSYLIFDAKREDGLGGSDLYISFRTEDGRWSEAQNMGPRVNSPVDDIFGSVTPDGSALIFQRFDLAKAESNIFWVSAEFMHSLKANGASAIKR